MRNTASYLIRILSHHSVADDPSHDVYDSLCLCLASLWLDVQASPKNRNDRLLVIDHVLIEEAVKAL